MKLESIEQQLKYLLKDYENLRNEVSKLKDEICFWREFVNHNLCRLSKFHLVEVQNRKKCKLCEGYGFKYISPICDMGQDPKCEECKGKGYIWE